MFTTFKLNRGEQVQNAQNPFYPIQETIESLEDFEATTKFDHVVGEFTDGRRSKNNFISADVIMLDIDNDDKLQPEDWNDSENWTTVEKLNEMFGDYEYLISPSKSNMVAKGNRIARPKLHVFFPLGESVTTPEAYETLTHSIVENFRRKDGIAIFDTAATDCARFFHGNTGSAIYNEGKSITTHLDHISAFDKMKNAEAPKMEGTDRKYSKNLTQKALENRGWTYTNIIKHFEASDFYGGEISGAKKDSKGWTICCGLHNDKNPSLKVFSDGFNFTCNSSKACGSGNAFEYIARKLGKTIEDVVNTYCDELEANGIGEDCLTAEDAVVEEMNKYAALLTGESKTDVMVPSEDNVIKKSWHHFKLVERGQTEVGDKHLWNADIWLNSPKRREYNKIVFDPAMKEVPKSGENFNLWFDFVTGDSGFNQFIDLEKYNSFSANPEDANYCGNACDMYLDHISKNICGVTNSDEQQKALEQYILFWMADGIVNPTRIARTALVIRGDQGAGKNAFADRYLELYGKFGEPITSPETLTGKFNWALKECLLAVADEAVFSGDAVAKNKLKTWIKAEKMSYESKGFDSVVLNNYTRFIFLSNEDKPVSLELGDRRHQVLEIGNGRKRDADYFNAQTRQWNNGGKEAFLFYLREVVAKDSMFADYNFEKFIETDARNKLIVDSNPVMSWWSQVMADGYMKYQVGSDTFKIEFIEGINTFDDPDLIFDSYCTYLQKARGKKPFFDRTQLLRELKKLNVSIRSNFQKMSQGVRKPQWGAGPLSELREEWAAIAGDQE